LASRIQTRVPSHDAPVAYRLTRAMIRFGLRLFCPRLRLLNRERLDQPGPAILLITHPRSVTVALLLISALDRQVHCLLPSGELRGLFRKMAAWALGIQAFDFTREEQNSRLYPSMSILAGQGAIALFAERYPRNGAHRAPVADFAARLAVEAILQGQDQLQPTIYPVHWLLGAGRRGTAPLMCVDSPIQAKDFLPKTSEDLTEASQHLVGAIQDAISASIFSLAEPDLEHFSRELEDLSREHLRRQWSQRPNWKQRPEDLELSDFARRWIAEQNRTDPGRLVELRELLDAYREARRRCAMGQLIVETSGPWQASNLRVATSWIETVLGFPVALYGLINHFLALIILSISGLLRNSPRRDPKVEWLLRIFTVLSSYTGQIFVVHFWWGRAVAGYYALTLPVSGAYLWRYRWLIRRRIHVLIRKALHPARSARVARERRTILARFDREIDRYAQSSTPPDMQSHGLAE
jgi:glycerol-3-phosphate O-acyltransferase / dihydroxyacetone phosphate acyltransferase